MSNVGGLEAGPGHGRLGGAGLLGRLRAKVAGRGEGEALGATRTLFLLLVLANLAYLTVVSAGGDPSLAKGVATVVGFVLLAVIWVVVARGDRFPAGADLACAGGLALLAYGSPTIVDGITLFGVASIYRGVMGGDAFTATDRLTGMPYRAVLLYLAGYEGGRVLEHGDITKLLAELVFLAPVAVSASVIGRVLARNAAARDRALQRELHLSAAIRALGAATDPTEMYQIVVRSALALLGPLDGARVTLLVPDTGGYTALAAEGSDKDATLGLHADVMPPAVAAALGREQAHWLTPEENREVAEALHLSRFNPFVMMLPLHAAGRRGEQGPSVLVTAFPTRPAPEFVNALGVLVADAASELASAALTAQLAHQARHDTLTALANRAAFADRLDHAVADRTGHPDDPDRGLAVVFLDLDDFKTVNDTLGHPAGDEVLTAVAARLGGARRSTDLVGRLGGDEFAVIVDPVATEAEARAIAGRFHDAVSHPVAVRHLGTVPGGRVPCTASVGVAVWAPGLSGGQLLAHADTAMYAAKQHKDTVATYDAELATAATEQCRVRRAPEHGLGHDQLEIHHQPKPADSDPNSTVDYEEPGGVQ